MHRSKQKLSVLLICFMSLCVFLIKPGPAQPALTNTDFPLPVSINALMVTMIDHSAHYIWDYDALEGDIVEDEWLAVEYYAIQLAASGPLITLGGIGEMDNSWVSSPAWTQYSRDMSNAAIKAQTAARIQDVALLSDASAELLDSCLGCHEQFKPAIPSEGIMHDPLYDRLYHLFEREF